MKKLYLYQISDDGGETFTGQGLTRQEAAEQRDKYGYIVILK